MVSPSDRILNAIELKDPIDRIPKMELFASVLPTGKFLIKHHYYPKRVQKIVQARVTESVNTVREIMGMKDKEPFTNYDLFGRTIRKMSIIEKITKKIFNDLKKKKSKEEVEKDDKGLANIQALATRMGIKLGYDLWGLIL